MAGYNKGLMFAIIAALVSGVSVFINGVAVKLADPVVYTALKNVGALLFAGALVLALREIHIFRNISGRQWLTLMLIGIIGGSVPFVMFFWGLKLGGAVVSSFIFRSLFIFAGIFGYIILKERVEPKNAVAAAIILAGNALLISGEIVFGVGQLLVLGATILWALEYTISRKVMANVHPHVVIISRMLFGSVVLLGVMYYDGTLTQVSIAPETFMWLAITSSLLFLFLINWYSALRELPMLKASSILAAGGIVTAVLNLAFLSKVPALGEAFGLLLMLAGIVAMVGLREIAETVAGALQARTRVAGP